MKAIQKNTLSLALAMTAGMLVACGNDKPTDTKPDTSAQTQAQPASEQKEAIYYFSDAAALDKAQTSLAELPKFQGKPIKFFQNIEFYNSKNRQEIHIVLQDPDNPKNVDEYHYDFNTGTWGEPKPIQLIGGGDIESNLADLSKIRFADIADKVLPAYDEQIKANKVENLKEDKPTNVSLMNDLMGNGGIHWFVSVDTDRNKYYLEIPIDTWQVSFKGV